MNIAMTAAASARVSIISFLKKAAIRFKTISLSKMRPWARIDQRQHDSTLQSAGQSHILA
jgi:hypothetical protein